MMELQCRILKSVIVFLELNCFVLHVFCTGSALLYESRSVIRLKLLLCNSMLCNTILLYNSCLVIRWCCTILYPVIRPCYAIPPLEYYLTIQFLYDLVIALPYEI